MQEIEKRLEKLPCEAQKAVCWLVANIDFMEAISAGEKLPETTLNRFIYDARKRNDYTMLAMLLYLLLYNKRNNT